MGKTQSKRSVDITTEGKKSLDEEITGKLEKIEDVDQRKQGNGDASQESLKTEKKVEVDESENDKDLTTEKCGDSQQNSEIVETTNNKHSNEATENATEENVNVEEICPLSDESIKKSKKEKVKKKWSFRSLSFGKKDKQKPGKSDEEVLANGEMDKATITSDPPIIGESVKETGTKIDTAVSENEIADQEKSTPIDESTVIVAPVPEEFTKSTVIDNQTGETVDTGNDEIFATAETIVTDVTSLNGNEAEEVTIIANKSSSSSEFINEVVNNIIITDKDNGYNAEKSKDNAITEQQQTNSHIEVITDNDSEEHIKSDPIVPNQIEENVVVNDNNNSNDIKNISENLSESLENSVQTGFFHPPPLPCSPPPSQVSVFAFSDNNESETATEEIPSISPENSPTNIEHNYIEQSTSVQKSTKSEFKNEFNIEKQKISDDEELNSSIADVQNVKGGIAAERVTLEDLESPTEIEETIAERVVQEITETAVEIIKDKNHEDNDVSAVEKDTHEGDNLQDVCINSPQTSLFQLITSDTNNTIPDNVTQCEIETILKQTEDCSLDKIAKLSLTEDDLTNDNDISKEKTMEDKAPELTTPNPPENCE